MVSEETKLIEFLIMENLPVDGSYLNLSSLKNNVMSDFLSMKKCNNLNIFEISLENLSEKQFVFVNKGKNKVAATQYGIVRSS
tara:strand:+ start:202 stop:450 length:249 start_codon:yes stop_codon:yes gene_type:complete